VTARRVQSDASHSVVATHVLEGCLPESMRLGRGTGRRRGTVYQSVLPTQDGRVASRREKEGALEAVLRVRRAAPPHGPDQALSLERAAAE
jgi:hypothetical protein